MDGILCIDKPADFTSFDVVAKMRGILRTRKIGHSGTLDPMATGVLPLFLGRATKACDMLPDQTKRYTATFLLGQTTDTQDSTGTVLQTRPVTVGRQEVSRALAGFVGAQKQLPPMYSAVRVNGQRLYDLARQGADIPREARDITIFGAELLAQNPNGNEAAHTYTIDIDCSKGTYIRTICHDLGEQLGCGAVLTALRRTRACGYHLADCITLEQAQSYADSGRWEETGVILPVETAFAMYPAVHLDAEQTRLFTNGVQLSLARMDLDPLAAELFTIFAADGSFLGLASTDVAEDALICRKWFGQRG